MNEDTLLDQDMAEAITLLREAVKTARVTPAPKTPNPKNPTVAKLLANFRRRVEEENGKCFRTEVRSTGVFICGLHHTAIWADGVSTCPHLSALLDIFESVVAREFSMPAEPAQTVAQPQRWPDPDGTKASWGGDPDVTKVDFWPDLMEKDEHEKLD